MILNVAIKDLSQNCYRAYGESSWLTVTGMLKMQMRTAGMYTFMPGWLRFIYKKKKKLKLTLIFKVLNGKSSWKADSGDKNVTVPWPVCSSDPAFISKDSSSKGPKILKTLARCCRVTVGITFENTAWNR